MGKGIDGVKLKLFIANQIGVSSCFLLWWTELNPILVSGLRKASGMATAAGAMMASPSHTVSLQLLSLLLFPTFPVASNFPMAFLLASTSKFGGHYLVCIIVLNKSTCDHLSSRAHSAVVCLVLMFLLLEIAIRAPQ